MGEPLLSRDFPAGPYHLQEDPKFGPWFMMALSWAHKDSEVAARTTKSSGAAVQELRQGSLFQNYQSQYHNRVYTIQYLN